MKTPYRLIAALEGPPFTGKTHWMLTAPRPIELFNIDFGYEGIPEVMEDEGYSFSARDITVHDYRLKKAPLSTIAAVDGARQMTREFIATWRATMQKRPRITICQDTSSELWKYFRLADLGKLKEVPPMRYDRVNMLWSDLLNHVFRTPHSMILTHRMKDRYIESIVKGKKVSVRVSGEYEREAYKHIEYIVQVFLLAWRKDRPGKPSVFGVTVTKCRQRPMLVGESYSGPLATFANLAMDVFPRSGPEDWGV